MANKQAGMGAALVVLAVVFGLMTIVGVILLMMWFEPGIEHSPAEHSALLPSSTIAARVSHVSISDSHSDPLLGGYR
jgi:hypothetical protein